MRCFFVTIRYMSYRLFKYIFIEQKTWKKTQLRGCDNNNTLASGDTPKIYEIFLLLKITRDSHSQSVCIILAYHLFKMSEWRLKAWYRYIPDLVAFASLDFDYPIRAIALALNRHPFHADCLPIWLEFFYPFISLLDWIFDSGRVRQINILCTQF